MFPLRDTTPRKTFPYINYLLILANSAMFWFQLSQPDFDTFAYQLGFVPRLFDYTRLTDYTTVFTSMFMHGSFFHIISNLWFLHIFGDNVEDEFGHFWYLIVYLASGVAAVAAQYMINPESGIPLIGASGAISGISGAYIVLFFRSKILALVPIGFVLTTITLPAWFFLGYWFVLQLVNGVSFVSTINYDQGGVAYFAHIGGFLFGLLAAILIAPLVRSFRNWLNG
jgi:membrane associated rhomboid family serine protease